MTAKKDSKRKPKKAERPKIKKETLSDLDVKGTDVRGGRPNNNCTIARSGCIS